MSQQQTQKAPAKFDNGPEEFSPEVQRKARIVWFVALFLCSVSFVLQIISISTKDMLNGNKVITEGSTTLNPVVGRVWRSYGAWTSCQTVYGNLKSVQTGCWSTVSNDCNVMQQRIICVQASGIIAVIFTGIALIPHIFGALGIKHTDRFTLRITFILVFIEFAFTMIVWTIVAGLMYNSNPSLCSGERIIDVDNSLGIGNSLIEEVVAWICGTLQFVLLIVIAVFLSQPKEEEGKGDVARNEPVSSAAATTKPAAAPQSGPTEPAAAH